MQPIFKVVADTKDITHQIKQRLLSITTTDEAGMKSDTCTIGLDDRDDLIELPKHGAKLEIYLGYQETGLSLIGLYTVDEVSLSGWPATLSINGKAADMRASLKSQKSRSFDNITLGDLVKTVAKEHGLTGKISQSLATVSYGHLDQTEESDLHLLTRLAKQQNAVAKVTNDILLISVAGQSKSVSGQLLPKIYINKGHLADYRVSIADRGKYAAVTATWHNQQTGQKVQVSTSDQKPAFLIRHTYDDEQKAIEAAKSKLDDLNHGATTLNLSLSIGEPNLFAETPVQIQGFKPAIDAINWTVKRVEHVFSVAGFTTMIECEAKG